MAGTKINYLIPFASIRCAARLSATYASVDTLTSGWFDWDRYHARQDACAEKDRIVAQCARDGDYCDGLALRQAQRAQQPRCGGGGGFGLVPSGWRWWRGDDPGDGSQRPA